jgi:O-antigen ligase
LPRRAAGGQVTGLSLRPIGTALGWALLLLLLPLAPVFGSLATVAALIMAILLIPAALTRHGWPLLREQPAMWIFAGVFVALALVFMVTANDPADTRFALNFISLPLAVAVFLVAGRYIDPAEAGRTIAMLCLGGTVAATVLAVGEMMVLGDPIVTGIGMGPRVLARVVLVFGFMALAALFVLRSAWRLTLYLAPILALIVVYLSDTRGALLAIPVIGLIHVAFLVADRRERRHGFIVAGAGLAGLTAVTLGSSRAAVIISDLLAGSSSIDQSATERVRMLEAAWTLFREKPLLGHGWGNFAEISFPLLGNIVNGGPSDPFFQFHNDAANFAVAAGIVGVVCWVGLLAAPLIGVFATPRDTFFRLRLYCCLQLSASYLVFGLTDLTIGYDLTTTIYAFLTAIVLGAFREPPTPGRLEVAASMRQAA